MTSTPAVFVITTVHGRHQHLRRMRQGLATNTFAPKSHIVVSMDDAQAADVAAGVNGPLDTVTANADWPGTISAEALSPGARASDHAPAVGPLPLARARNRGASRSREISAAGSPSPDDLLVFLDVDCIPAPTLLQAYVEAAAQRPDDLLCGPVSYLPDIAVEDYSAENLRRLAQPHPARPAPAQGEILTSGDHRLFWSLSFALRRRTWERIGGFDEAYSGYGGEDTDFAQKARALDIELSWVGGAQAFHQYHPVSDPPVEHLDEILANGAHFARKWGQWPMEGWLAQFEEARLIRKQDQGYLAVPLHIASVPHSHVYIRHLSPTSSSPSPAVIRLPAPAPAGSRPPAGAPWWPPAMLDPEWIAHHDFDVFHIHFGFDAYSPAQLTDIADALDAKGVPLIYTAHDLQNPHHTDPSTHQSQLDVLIPRAAAVLTLSEDAAEYIRSCWGVEAEVIPHPHVVDFPTMEKLAASPTRRNDEFRLGIHLKSLRQNMSALPLLQAAAAAVSEIPGGVLQVNIHHDVYDIDGARHDPELVTWLVTAREDGRIDLHVHDFFTDAELFEYLAGLHASLLPYRFGTHSGWLEACHDLGTLVIAPDVGCYRSQGADLSYHWEAQEPTKHTAIRRGELLDPVSVHQAVSEAAQLIRGNRDPAQAQTFRSPAQRIQSRSLQRDLIARAHTRVYRKAVMRQRLLEKQTEPAPLHRSAPKH